MCNVSDNRNILAQRLWDEARISLTKGYDYIIRPDFKQIPIIEVNDTIWLNSNELIRKNLKQNKINAIRPTNPTNLYFGLI